MKRNQSDDCQFCLVFKVFLREIQFQNKRLQSFFHPWGKSDVLLFLRSFFGPALFKSMPFPGNPMLICNGYTIVQLCVLPLCQEVVPLFQGFVYVSYFKTFESIQGLPSKSELSVNSMIHETEMGALFEGNLHSYRLAYLCN